jgi:hypothetical protein
MRKLLVGNGPDELREDAVRAALRLLVMLLEQ